MMDVSPLHSCNFGARDCVCERDCLCERGNVKDIGAVLAGMTPISTCVGMGTCFTWQSHDNHMIIT